ncbi:hypothetical protein V8C86DRAFT_195379 [Haematococcus lacustris]
MAETVRDQLVDPRSALWVHLLREVRHVADSSQAQQQQQQHSAGMEGPALASPVEWQRIHSLDLSSFTHPGLTASLLVLHLQLYEAALIVIHHCPAPAASPSTTNPTAAHTGGHTSSVMGLFSRASASSRQAAAGPEAAVPAASASAVKPDQGRLLGGLRGAWASPPSQLPKGPPAGSPSSPTARLGQDPGAAAPPATGTVAGGVRASASAGGASGAAAGVSAQGPGVLGGVESVLREAGRDVARRFAPSRELLLAAVWPSLPRQLLSPWVTLTPEPAPGSGSGQQLAESGKGQAATVPGRAGAGGTGPQQRKEDRGRANGSKLWQLGQEGQVDEDSWASQVTSTPAISHPPSLPPPFPAAQHLDGGDSHSHSGRVSEEDVQGRSSSVQGHSSLGDKGLQTGSASGTAGSSQGSSLEAWDPDRDLWQGLVRPGARGRPPLPLPTTAATGQQDRQKPGKAGHSSTVSCWPARRVSRPAVVTTAAPLPAPPHLAQPQAERAVPAPTPRTGLTVAPAVMVAVEVGRPVPVAGEPAAAPVAASHAVGAGELACQRLEAAGASATGARVELELGQDTASAQTGSTSVRGEASTSTRAPPSRLPLPPSTHPPGRRNTLGPGLPLSPRPPGGAPHTASGSQPGGRATPSPNAWRRQSLGPPSDRAAVATATEAETRPDASPPAALKPLGASCPSGPSPPTAARRSRAAPSHSISLQATSVDLSTSHQLLLPDASHALHNAQSPALALSDHRPVQSAHASIGAGAASYARLPSPPRLPPPTGTQHCSSPLTPPRPECHGRQDPAPTTPHNCSHEQPPVGLVQRHQKRNQTSPATPRTASSQTPAPHYHQVQGPTMQGQNLSTPPSSGRRRPVQGKAWPGQEQQATPGSGNNTREARHRARRQQREALRQEEQRLAADEGNKPPWVRQWETEQERARRLWKQPERQAAWGPPPPPHAIQQPDPINAYSTAYLPPPFATPQQLQPSGSWVPGPQPTAPGHPTAGAQPGYGPAGQPLFFMTQAPDSHAYAPAPPQPYPQQSPLGWQQSWPPPAPHPAWPNPWPTACWPAHFAAQPWPAGSGQAGMGWSGRVGLPPWAQGWAAPGPPTHWAGAPGSVGPSPGMEAAHKKGPSQAWPPAQPQQQQQAGQRVGEAKAGAGTPPAQYFAGLQGELYCLWAGRWYQVNIA